MKNFKYLTLITFFYITMTHFAFKRLDGADSLIFPKRFHHQALRFLSKKSIGAKPGNVNGYSVLPRLEFKLF